MSEEIKSLEELGSNLSKEDNPGSEIVQKKYEQSRDKFGRSYATGKRKNSVSRVWVKPGSGNISVNGKNLEKYLLFTIKSVPIRLIIYFSFLK